MTRAFFYDHGLSIALGVIGLAGLGLSAAFDAGWWRDAVMGVGHGGLTSLAVVLLTKYLRERGSPASK